MKLIVPAIVLVILVSLGVVSCGGHRRDLGHRTDYVVKKLSRELDLTDDQRTKVRQLADETWADMESRKTEWQSKHDDVKQLFLSDRLTATDVEGFIDDHTPDHEEMRQVFAQRLAEFHAILTPDQREKLVNEVEKKWDRHGRWGRSRRR